MTAFSDWLQLKFEEWEKSKGRRRQSYTAFARHLGVTQPSLAHWMMGDNLPDAESVVIHFFFFFFFFFGFAFAGAATFTYSWYAASCALSEKSSACQLNPLFTPTLTSSTIRSLTSAR